MGMLRQAAERVSRGRILLRRLPPDFGRLPIYVSPDAGLRFWLPLKRADPLLFRMARELVQPGAVVWDIGANVGLFAFSAAALASPSGHVLAVEPDIEMANLLMHSVERTRKFKRAPVSVLCAAVSESNGLAELEIAQRARASNHLARAQGSTQARGVRHRQATCTVSLDSLLEFFPAPTVLKIDVETHEPELLRGASKVLSSCRPVMWCEVAKENSAEVAKILSLNNYTLYSAAVAPAQRTPIMQAYWNTLAVPQSISTRASEAR